jgi:DNA-binding LacI/PurR family transcriptional regulator
MTDDPANNGKSLKTQLSDHLRSEIARGAYAPGSVLESQRDLCEKHGVSRITVRAALDVLERQGLIKRYARRGAVVAATPQQAARSHAQVEYAAPRRDGRTSFLYLRWSPSRSGSEMLSGLMKACRELDVDLQIFEARRNREMLLDCLRNLPPNIDGLLYEPLKFPEELDAVKALIDKGTAVVFNELPPDGFSVNAVTTDNFTAGYLATDHLLNLWHRPVYHVGGTEEANSFMRLKGWKETMLAHGFDDHQEFLIEDRNDPPCEEVVRGHDYDPGRLGYEAGEIIFSRDKPINGGYSIFTVNDQVARAIYVVAEKYGLRVGVDVHLVGFEDYPFAARLRPPLSTIRESQSTGYAAAKLLWRILHNPPDNPLLQVVPVELVERESSLGLTGGGKKPSSKVTASTT